MKIIFAGTPEFAVPTLQALLDSQHEVVAVYTQPDRPAGRGQQMRASPVKQRAALNDIPVIQPHTLKSEEAIAALTSFEPALMVVVAYGLILPVSVLAIADHGCLNVHASLLPRWRGAAPIQRAILAGDKKTGITIMQMAEGLDTGDMLKKSELVIQADASAGVLHDELAEVGARSLLQVVNEIAAGEPPVAERQDESQTCYAHKLSKSEAEIDWALPAQQILRMVKAFNPWPVAYTCWSGKALRIWDAKISYKSVSANPGELISLADNTLVVACGQGALTMLEVQPEGKKRMPVKAYLNARKAEIIPGVVFG